MLTGRWLPNTKKKTVPHRQQQWLFVGEEKGTAEAPGEESNPRSVSTVPRGTAACHKVAAGKIITDNNEKDVPLVEFMFRPCIHMYAG